MDNVKGYNKDYSYNGYTDGDYKREYVSDKEYWEMIGYESYPTTETEVQHDELH